MRVAPRVFLNSHQPEPNERKLLPIVKKKMSRFKFDESAWELTVTLPERRRGEWLNSCQLILPQAFCRHWVNYLFMSLAHNRFIKISPLFYDAFFTKTGGATLEDSYSLILKLLRAEHLTKVTYPQQKYWISKETATWWLHKQCKSAAKSYTVEPLYNGRLGAKVSVHGREVSICKSKEYGSAHGPCEKSWPL